MLVCAWNPVGSREIPVEFRGREGEFCEAERESHGVLWSSGELWRIP